MDPEPLSLFLILNTQLPVLIGTFSLILLLFFSALISGSEIAFFSLSKAALEESDSPKINSVKQLLNRPKKLLATILIANNFINILIVLIFAYLGEFYFSAISSAALRFAIEVVLVTFLILLFGEVIPKVYANRNALKFASFMAFPIKILRSVFSFISAPLMGMTSVIERRLGKKKSDFSVETLSQALELTSEEATTKEEHKILEGIVNFGNTETVQVMCPRMDVFAISDEESFEEIIKKIVKKGKSRIPVYHDNIDEIKGVLFTKDLLPHLQKKSFKWNSILRKAYFIPENKKLDDLLKEFQETKNHLAIVVDEYGGTSGIVTLEDVIEEIVGDISDEFDDDDLSYSKIDSHNFVFEGKISIKDFCKIIKVDESEFEEDKGEAETLAGFVLEINERFPRPNESIKFNGYTFKIEHLEKKRIKQLKVTLPHD